MITLPKALLDKYDDWLEREAVDANRHGEHRKWLRYSVLPARSPPQLEFGFDQTPATDDWPEMDQTAGRGADGWE